MTHRFSVVPWPEVRRRVPNAPLMWLKHSPLPRGVCTYLREASMVGTKVWLLLARSGSFIFSSVVESEIVYFELQNDHVYRLDPRDAEKFAITVALHPNTGELIYSSHPGAFSTTIDGNIFIDSSGDYTRIGGNGILLSMRVESGQLLLSENSVIRLEQFYTRLESYNSSP